MQCITMARLDPITSLTRTALIMLGALALSISASALAPGVRNSFESMAYASPAQSVDTLSTHQAAITDQVDTTDQINTTDQIDITEVSNIASEILPNSEVESRSYPSTLPDFSAINDVRTKKHMFFSNWPGAAGAVWWSGTVAVEHLVYWVCWDSSMFLVQNIELIGTVLHFGGTSIANY